MELCRGGCRLGIDIDMCYDSLNIEEMIRKSGVE